MVVNRPRDWAPKTSNRGTPRKNTYAPGLEPTRPQTTKRRRRRGSNPRDVHVSQKTAAPGLEPTRRTRVPKDGGAGARTHATYTCPKRRRRRGSNPRAVKTHNAHARSRSRCVLAQKRLVLFNPTWNHVSRCVYTLGKQRDLFCFNV